VATLSFAKTGPTFTNETFCQGSDWRVAHGRIALNVTSAPLNVLWIKQNGLCAMRADGALMSSVRAPADPLFMRPAVRSGDEDRRLPESR
jgi:hypothetical protein